MLDTPVSPIGFKAWDDIPPIAWDDGAKWWECKHGKEVRGDPSVSIPARNGNRRPNPVIFAPNAGRSNSCGKLATVLSAGEFLVRLPRYTAQH